METLAKTNVRSLWKVSFPLMISYFSLMAMLFVDRLFLAQLSESALTAATRAGTFTWGISLGWVTLASMAEVFTAQFNGAKEYNKLGVPSWQMIWLCCLSIAFFLPMAYFGPTLFYGAGIDQLQEKSYFFWMMLFSPFFAMLSAISAFFIGRGKTHIITLVAVAGNVFNVLLDPILIFGVDGWIAPLGISGAAIATGISQIMQIAILFAVFLSKQNRARFETHRWQYDSAVFWGCLKIGLSPSIFVSIELMGWALFYNLMARVSPLHIFLSGVMQSIVLLLMFFGISLEKGVIAIAGNLIGAKQAHEMSHLVRSSMILVGLFTLLVSLFLLIFPDTILSWFFKSSIDAYPKDHVSVSFSLQTLARLGLGLSFIYVLFENIRWIFSGILTAAGDTNFLLIAGSVSIWVFLIAPTYFWVVLPKRGVEHAFFLWAIYAVLSMGLVIWRFSQGKWKAKSLWKKQESADPSI